MKLVVYLASIALPLITLPIMADTFTLKDGTTLKATILSEVGDSYMLEVQVTASIKDERKVLKSDVVKVVREQHDLTAFAPFEKLLPTPDLLAVDGYALNITAITKFIKDFPESSKLAEAKTLLDTLTAESALVAAGGIKFNGKMLTAAEYQENAYDLDSRVQAAKILRLANNNQTLAALRLFAEFERDFSQTASRSALLATIRPLIQNHLAEMEQSSATLDARLGDRIAGLSQMSLADRGNTQSAIEEETAQIEARYQAEKLAKEIWLTTTPYHKASLADAITNGVAELTRINAVQTTLGADGGKAFRDVWNAVNSGGSATAVATAMTAAKTALVPARYLAPLEEAAKSIK